MENLSIKGLDKQAKLNSPSVSNRKVNNSLKRDHPPILFKKSCEFSFQAIKSMPRIVLLELVDLFISMKFTLNRW